MFGPIVRNEVIQETGRAETRWEEEDLVRI